MTSGPDGAGAPVSYQQLGVWTSEQASAASGLWTVPVVVEFEQRLGIEHVASCLAVLLDRHESLRTAFIASDNGPVRRIAIAGSLAPRIREVDTRGIPAATVDEELHRLADEPMDVERAPLSRVLLVQHDNGTTLRWELHHLIVDLVSVRILVRELDQLLRGRTLPAPAPTYSEYVAIQSGLAAGSAKRSVLLNLPVPPFTSAAGDLSAAFSTVNLEPDLQGAVARLTRTAAALPSSVYTAAWLLTLAVVCGQSRVQTGVPIAHRGSRQFRELVGLLTTIESVDVALDDPTLTGRQLIGQISGRLRELATSDKVTVATSNSTMAGFRPAQHDAVINVIRQGTGGSAMPSGARVIEQRPAMVRQLLNLEVTLSRETTTVSLTRRAAVLDERIAGRLLREFVATLAGLTDDPDSPLATLIGDRSVEREACRSSLRAAQGSAAEVLPPSQVRISQPDPCSPQFVAEVSRVTGTELTALRKAYTLPLESLVLRWRTPVELPQTAQLGELAAEVRRAWSEVLEMEHPQPDDDFFEVGGTSLQAASLANRLSRVAGKRITMRMVMDSLSLADLTTRVAELAGS